VRRVQGAAEGEENSFDGEFTRTLKSAPLVVNSSTTSSPTAPGLQGQPTEEVDRCVPQELSLDCCLENERVLGHTGRLLVDIHLLCWGLWGISFVRNLMRRCAPGVSFRETAL